MKLVAIILLFALAGCLVVRQPKGGTVPTKIDTLTIVHKDSSQVIRYDSIVHSLDTIISLTEPPKFTDSLSMIDYLKNQLEAKNGQLLSLTNAIRGLKPEPCTNTERTIEKQSDNQLATAIGMIVAFLIAKFTGKKNDSK